MSIDPKEEVRNCAVYFLTAMSAIFIHETGHCIPAWLHRCAAVPTPAQEYILHTVSTDLNQQISLGGYIDTVLFTLVILPVFLFTGYKYKSALFGGVISVSGMYCTLFFINGRGHGGHEFQEAQAALGLNYSGHSMDWFFITLFLALVVTWFVTIRPGYKVIPRLLIGSVTTFFFFIALEWINKVIFDPIFQDNAFPRNLEKCRQPEIVAGTLD